MCFVLVCFYSVEFRIILGSQLDSCCRHGNKFRCCISSNPREPFRAPTTSRHALYKIKCHVLPPHCQCHLGKLRSNSSGVTWWPDCLDGEGSLSSGEKYGDPNRKRVDRRPSTRPDRFLTDVTCRDLQRGTSTDHCLNIWDETAVYRAQEFRNSARKTLVYFSFATDRRPHGVP